MLYQQPNEKCAATREPVVKKYITILAVSLICHNLAAEDIAQHFQTVDTLITYVKQANPTDIICDTNEIIVGVHLPLDCCTDSNLRLLGKIKSIRYLLICGHFTSTISTNGILALAEYPNLTGLCLVCCGAPSKHLVSALPCLTNLQSLELEQDTYRTNDAIYLAKMTNLVSLAIGGFIPQTQSELLTLTNLVNLQRLLIFGSDEAIKRVDGNIFSKFNKLTAFVIASDLDLWEKARWKMPP